MANPFANKIHLPAPASERDKHFTLCEKSTGPIAREGEEVTCPICLRLSGTWFPPLAGDQPNEQIIPIGQTEAETPEEDV